MFKKLENSFFFLDNVTAYHVMIIDSFFEEYCVLMCVCVSSAEYSSL